MPRRLPWLRALAAAGLTGVLACGGTGADLSPDGAAPSSDGRADDAERSDARLDREPARASVDGASPGIDGAAAEHEETSPMAHDAGDADDGADPGDAAHAGDAADEDDAADAHEAGDDRESADGEPIDSGAPGEQPEEARWPSRRTPLPGCASARPFVEPALASPSGPVAILRQAVLEPVGHDVRVPIEIRGADGEVDTSAEGALAVVSDDALTSVPAVVVADGRAEAVLRFVAAGTRTITATLSDGRAGTVQIEAFDSRLPVWELTAEPTELEAVMNDPAGTLKASVAVQLGESHYTGKVRLHGGSSRYYPKQSFRIDLASGQAFADGSDHAIMRSEWNDKTMLRNYLSSEVMRNGTWVPSFRAEPVHLRINGQYYGVMWRAQRVDEDFLVEHGLPPDGSLYEADPPLAVSVPGGNLTTLASRDAYPLVYQHHAGRIEYDDLVSFIEQTLTLSEDDFRARIESEVMVDDVLVFLSAMAVIQNHDHIRKNYYLYRDPSLEPRWRVLPWDLDLTFGHLYTDEADVLDERIFTDESLYFGERVAEHDFYNQLTTRLLAVPQYRARFRAYTEHIANDVLSDGFIEGRIASFFCVATPDVLADTRKRASNDEYLSRVDELRAFIRARRAFVATQ
jgi:hypothetical protein